MARDYETPDSSLDAPEGSEADYDYTGLCSRCGEFDCVCIVKDGEDPPCVKRAEDVQP